MVRNNDSSPTLGDIWETLKGVTLTGACKPKDPMRARRELIAQYNRKPSIYVEPNVGRDCANLIGGLAASMSGFMQQALGSNGDGQSEAHHRHKVAPRVESGVPRCVVCDALDVSLFKVLQRAICYAGAGLGLVGIGLVSAFGICAAAGTACTVTVCNKVVDNSCEVSSYDPVDTEVYYEGKSVVNVQNNYAPIQGRGAIPTYNHVPAHLAH